jgi:hypothetical protein
VTSIPNVCFNNDYVELRNTGATTANLSGWMLYDNNGATDEDAFTFPPQFVMAAGEIRFLCQNLFGSFKFGIGIDDVITLANRTGGVVSTTGNITSAGSSTSTYQRNSNGTYAFSSPTPGTENFITPTMGMPIINEVVFNGTSNATSPCFGTPFVEIYNDAFARVNLTNYVLRAGANSYVFPNGTINAFSYFTFCGGPGILPIGSNDNVTLSNAEGAVVSVTGPIGGTSPRPSVPELAWVRVTDLVITSAPFQPFYQYSTTPTPGRLNIFPFTPVQQPVASCGIQTKALAMVSNYQLKFVTDVNVNGGDPELSGGAFDPRTCTHISVGDNGAMVEFTVTNTSASIIRDRPLIGGSRSSPIYGSFPDSEGVCFYRDTVNGDKLAIIDERDRSGMYFFSFGLLFTLFSPDLFVQLFPSFFVC